MGLPQGREATRPKSIILNTLAQPTRRTLWMLTAIGCVFLAGVMMVAFDRPVPVLAALLVASAALAVFRFPVAVLIGLLFVEPFHAGIVLALHNRADISLGSLAYWKDALIIALFVRGLVERYRADRRLPLRDAGDNVLLFYVAAYLALAIASPPRGTVYPALSHYVEGVLLFLAIRFLRPSRRELWLCAAALLAAATIMGGAAVIERLGPQEGFPRWYGAPDQGTISFNRYATVYRSGSFLNDPLTLGFYLAAATSLAVALAVVRTRWRAAVLFSAAVCGAGLIVTGTRSSYIGGGIGVITALLLAVRNPRIRISLVGLVVVVAGATSLYYVAVDSEALIRPESTTLHRQTVEGGVRLLEARPFGHGLGTTDRFAYRSDVGPGALGATESTYLAKALEGGMQALVLYLMTLFVTAMRLRSARLRGLRAGDKTAVALAAGALGAMLAVALSGLFLGVQELVVEVMLWIPAAIALAWPLAEAGRRSAYDRHARRC